MGADRMVIALYWLHQGSFVVWMPRTLRSFVAALSKSYWTRCMKLAMAVCEQIRLNLSAGHFPFKTRFEDASKQSFSSLWRQDLGLDRQFLVPLRVKLLFAKAPV